MVMQLLPSKVHRKTQMMRKNKFWTQLAPSVHMIIVVRIAQTEIVVRIARTEIVARINTTAIVGRIVQMVIVIIIHAKTHKIRSIRHQKQMIAPTTFIRMEHKMFHNKIPMHLNRWNANQ